MSKKKKFVLYARVSTDDQSADMQVEQLREYAAFRSFEIVEVVEEQISSTVRVRPGREKVMKLARSGKVDGVLVWKFDRFARSTSELINSLDEFMELGVDFVSMKDSVDTTTPAGKAMFTMIAAFAEFERESTRERAKHGISRVKKIKAETGKVATKTGRWFGRQRLEHSMVQNILVLHEKGIGQTEIARRLGVGRTSVWRVVNGHHDSVAG